MPKICSKIYIIKNEAYIIFFKKNKLRQFGIMQHNKMPICQVLKKILFIS